MSFLQSRVRSVFRRSAVPATLAVALPAAAGAYWIATLPSGRSSETVADLAARAADQQEAPPDVSSVQLERSVWKTAGLVVAPVERGPLEQSLHVTGRLTLNEDRVAHIYPLVEGRVHEVRVRLGERVRKGDVLAVIQSKEVGERKLALVQSRLARDIAVVTHDRAKQINENTQKLIAALEREAGIDEIEQEFRDAPIGQDRERLLTGYATLAKASADYDRLTSLTDRGVTAAKDLAAAKVARDAARAAFTAMLEQAKFDVRQTALAAEQALREADARVAASEAALVILGYAIEDLKDIDPTAAGESLSYYPVVAPFDGTILTKDIALLESVGPDRQLFELADLSTLWVAADVFERHLSATELSEGSEILIRSDALPGLTGRARVFFTGERIEEQSRTLRLRATIENPDGRLKPGMFVEVELPGGETQSTLRIAADAIVEYAGESFVFVQTGEDIFERRDVTLGRTSGDDVEIRSGLNEGEHVAVSGTFALKSLLLADLLAED